MRPSEPLPLIGVEGLMEQAGNPGVPHQMLLHDLVCSRLVYVGVPGSLGIDHEVGPVSALPETPAEGDPNAVTSKALFEDRFLERMQGLFCALLAAGGTGANEKMVRAHRRFLSKPVFYTTSRLGE